MLTLLQLFIIFSLMMGTSLILYPQCFIEELPNPQNSELSYGIDPNYTYFLWNKTSMTAQEYAHDYCRSRCNKDQKINSFPSGNLRPTMDCLECECQRPACEIYDICCDELSEGLAVSNRSSFSAKLPKLGCDTGAFEYFQFLYIRSCPENYHDNEEVKRLCQEDVGVNDTTVETYVRVLDSDTQVVYYNSYCAMCNQVQKPVLLTLNPKCTNYMLVYMAEDINDFIRLLLLDSEHCTIYQAFEEGAMPIQCYKGQYSENQVNQCDRNDPQKMLDPDIVEACDQFTSNRYQVYDFYNRVYYKNIFCSICDWMSYPFATMYAMCMDTVFFVPERPYQMLIRLIDDKLEAGRTDSVNTCNETSWTSPNGQCLQLKCSPGKKLTNGTCTSIINQMKGLGYSVKTLLVFESWDKLNDSLTVNDLLDMAEKQVSYKMENINDGFSYQLGVAKYFYQISNKTVSPFLWADIFILASRFITRDTFEKEVFNLFFNESQNTTPLKFYRILTEDQFTQCCNVSSSSWPTRNKPLEIPHQDYYHDQYTAVSLGSKQRITLSLTLTCNFITFKQFKINFDKSITGQGIIVTLDLDGINVIISDLSDINTLEVTSDGELNVCRELLDKYTELYVYSKSYNISLMYKALMVLTYVCMGASELCLLMTLVTYICFSELRTAPGINNMFLSLSLLLAQLALIVASSIPGPSYFCTFIGIATHFLWLWNFLWSFLCSFYLFQVFTSKISMHFNKDTGIYSHLLKLLAFSLIVPAAIVCTVIISSYLTSQTIGYGRYSCYLDTTFLIGVSLIGPLCLVLLCNLTFLVVTVSSIHRVNRPLTSDSMKADQFKNLTLYSKLSTVTGAFWMVAIMAEALDNDILRIVSTLLNGLQGVAIFVSYTFNKRVYKLFSTRTSSSRLTSAPSSSETVLS